MRWCFTKYYSQQRLLWTLESVFSATIKLSEIPSRQWCKKTWSPELHAAWPRGCVNRNETVRMKILCSRSRLSHEFNASCIIFFLFYFILFSYPLYSFYTYHQEGKKECSICNQEFFQPSGVDCEPLITRRFLLLRISSSLFFSAHSLIHSGVPILLVALLNAISIYQMPPKGTQANAERHPTLISKDTRADDWRLPTADCSVIEYITGSRHPNTYLDIYN